MKVYKLLKNGHSHYCNLPPDFIKFCGINHGDHLVIRLNEVTKEIIIKKVELMKQ
jgi:hypothetical protein